MNDDLDGKPVYIDGIDYDADLLEKLCDTFDEEPTFELTPITSLITNKSFEEIMDSKSLIMQDNNLNTKHAEHNVLSLLILARENELM